MRKNPLLLSAALLTLALWAAPPALLAQEHPEHPAKAKEKKSEHPEHPEKTKPAPAPAPAFTVDDMAAAITRYVTADAKLKGGYFLVYDAKGRVALQLTLEKVHRERLSQIGDGVVFVCADFKGADGKVYDLDFFMKGPDKDHLSVTEITVHKQDGVARYTWSEEGGIWKRKSV